MGRGTSLDSSTPEGELTTLSRQTSSTQSRTSYRANGEEPSLLNRGAEAFSVDVRSANLILKVGQDRKNGVRWAKVRAVSHIISELKAQQQEHPMRI